MNFGRLLTAMITPFDKQGNLDKASLEPLVEHLLQTGTEGIVVAGTTGESPTLSTEEKLLLFQRVKEIVSNRAYVIAGTGTNDTRYSEELTEKATALGVDGVMVVTPYYNKPNQEGLFHHFQAIAKSTHLPVMIYNIPGRSVINMDATTTIRLANIPNITSVKEASGDMEQIATIIEHTPENFHVYSGDDAMTIPIMAVGGTGVVSVASHLIGRDLKRMMDDFADGKIQEAASLHRKLLPKMQGCFIAPNPTPVKAMLAELNIVTSFPRPPLVPLNESDWNKMKQLFGLV